MSRAGRWRIGLSLIGLATAVRVVWAVAVPTIPVGDFATYRESALQLAELGRLDHGFVYMPGWVVLLAGVHLLGGEVLAAKLLGAALGGLAAGALYVIAAGLFDDERGRDAVGPRGPGGWVAAAPVGLATGVAYALWPAGIALASVVGTDVPAAALMAVALAALVHWGPSRPLLAAAAFGAVMGLAAYVRAVALPLTMLSAVYWLGRRAGVRAAALRTAVAVALTVVVLLPWGLRNRRVNGEFFLTDSHGGITALMGNDPNTDGTYSRALGTTFRALTGRTFLTEPHRETDRIAYRLARRWITAQPGWTAGMIALRAERLFAAERGLLYWSVYRPGVLPAGEASWFNRHRPVITGVADWFYLAFVLALCAGAGFAYSERRWMVGVPAVLALAQAGTYVLFVAEPRYRLTTEVLLFPIAGFGAHRLVTRAFGVVRGRVVLRDRRALLGTGVALAVVVLAAVVAVYGGAALRARHRWAVAVSQVDGQPRLAMWLPGMRAAGVSSPVRGTAAGPTLSLGATAQVAQAEVHLPDAELPPGRVHVTVGAAWAGAEAAAPAQLSVGPAVLRAGDAGGEGTFVHAGGPVRLVARLEGPAPQLAGTAASPAPSARAVAVTVTALDLRVEGAP